MKTLYILALLSFAVLAFACFAITRHIRRNAQALATPLPDTELSDAIDLRLNDIVRSSPEQRAQAEAQHDFSYFNKEAPEKSRPATPERSRTTIERP